MTLYDIDAGILACADVETGEIIDEERLNALEMERDAKIEGVGLWVKDLKAESAAIKAEIDNLTKRRQAADNKAESLKKWMSYALGGEKLKTPRLSVSYTHSTKTVVDDWTLLPDAFLRP